MQVVLPPPPDIPAAHPMHVLAPVVWEYLPTSHVLQPVEDPISSWYCPEPQDAQPRSRVNTMIALSQPT